MCTAIADGHLFGRTLDLEDSYGEEIVAVGKSFPFHFIHEGKCNDHFAIVGTALLSDGIPLYYDAVNEKGLSAAALRFPTLAVYHDKSEREHAINLASFELIPWALSKFGSAADAKRAFENVTVTRDDFSQSLPSTPLHWIFADKDEAFIVESMSDGTKIYDAPDGVLTNSPDLVAQRENLALHAEIMRETCLIGQKNLDIAGDSSSPSRFIRAAYARSHIPPSPDGNGNISRFFHMMGVVNQPLGFAENDGGAPIRTVYTSCIDMKRLIYYFTTYSDRQIRAVRLEGTICDTVLRFSMSGGESICYLN